MPEVNLVKKVKTEAGWAVILMGGSKDCIAAKGETSDYVRDFVLSYRRDVARAQDLPSNSISDWNVCSPWFVRCQSIRHRPPDKGSQNSRFGGVLRA